MITSPLTHDNPNEPGYPLVPHSTRDPDDIRQQRLDDAWQFPDDDRDDGYEPPRPRITACIDYTQGRFR